MLDQKKVFMATTVVLIIALASAIGVIYGMISIGRSPGIEAFGTDDNDLKTLTVTGIGEASTRPDRAKIHMTITNEGRSARVVAERNADLFSKLLEQLSEVGLSKDDVLTTRYSISPIYNYYRDGRPPQIEGYRAHHQIAATVTSEDVGKLGERVGEIIDVAVGAGVNQISGVDFTVSEESYRELLNEALRNASEDARGKADVMAEALGVVIIGVQSAVEGYQFQPYPPVYRADIEGEGKAATELIPGELDVRASVQVVFSIGQ